MGRVDSPIERPVLRGELTRLRTWLEIDLHALVENVRRIRNIVHPARLLVTVKKDAYGHGIVPVARAIKNIGVDYFGVACVDEGLVLRRAGIRTPILDLGAPIPEEIEPAVAHDIELTVSTAEEARRISRAARRLDRRARVHLKIDTGMGRLGLPPEQLVEQIDAMAGAPDLEWVGLYSHLADCPGNAQLTHEQLERFRCVADATGDWLRVRHLGASGAIGDPRLHRDMVRIGIAAYGADPRRDDCGPVMSMKSRMVLIKDLPAGATISYGATYVTTEPTRVGVVCAGYGNGYPRLASNRGHVLVGGRPAPILGRVCMDQFMVGLNEHPGARVGDPVLLFGRDGVFTLPVSEVAGWAETISYETLCVAGAMNPRLYIGPANPDVKTPEIPA
jgi:alanine racemase